MQWIINKKLFATRSNLLTDELTIFYIGGKEALFDLNREVQYDFELWPHATNYDKYAKIRKLSIMSI